MQYFLLTFDFEQRLGGRVAYFVFGNTQKSATVLFSNSDNYGRYEDDDDYGFNGIQQIVYCAPSCLLL